MKIAIDYGYNFHMLDAIDSNKFYSCSKAIDNFIYLCQNKSNIQKVKKVYDIMESMHFGATAMGVWIDRKRNRLIQKRDKVNKIKGDNLQVVLTTFENNPNLQNFIVVLDACYSLTKDKCHYKELYHEIKRASKIAIRDNITMYEAMTHLKNSIRHMGRKIDGRCIGTTLLTKGLEFDTVVIYEAQKFMDAKNFYVAISRARKRLVFITSNLQIQF